MYGLNQEAIEALQRDMNSVGGDSVRDKHRGSNGKDSSPRSPGRSPVERSCKSHSASNDDFDDLLAFDLGRGSVRCGTSSLPNHSEQGDNNMPFEKGQSGNPGGRPKVVAEVKELARAHTGQAIETLVSIMSNPKSAPAARVSAANALLDRGYGKPPQHITGEGGPSYVVRLPEPCKTAEAWVASLGDLSVQKSLAVVHNKEPLVDS